MRVHVYVCVCMGDMTRNEVGGKGQDPQTNSVGAVAVLVFQVAGQKGKL